MSEKQNSYESDVVVHADVLYVDSDIDCCKYKDMVEMSFIFKRHVVAARFEKWSVCHLYIYHHVATLLPHFHVFLDVC